MLVITELLPKVQNLQASLNATTANSAIIDMLRSANIDHVLPKAAPLSPRRFMVCDIIPTCYKRGGLTDRAVVGRVYCVAYIAYMGRNLCTRNDTTGNLELDCGQVVLREARADTPTADHRDSDERSRRASRS